VRRWESSSRSKGSDFLRHAPGTRRSTPWRSSASALTLRNTRSSSASSGHVITPQLGRGFVHSDTTLVIQLLNVVRREKALRTFKVNVTDGNVQVNVPTI
jgi:hypothetical protein